MGAEVPVWVEVFKISREWVQVYGVTLEDGKRAARELPQVFEVGEAAYELPESESDSQQRPDISDGKS